MELPKRKPTRLKNYDYSSEGAYFITICTHCRKCLFSDIVGAIHESPESELNQNGKLVDYYIKKIDSRFDLSVDKYVIMPNHIHLILFVENIESILGNLETDVGGEPKTSTSARSNSIVSKFVSTFKRFCNKEYGENIWQRSFYDHIIRNQRDYDEVTKYIYENPIRWKDDTMYGKK